MMKYLITALIALVAGFAGAAIFSYGGLGHPQTRDYLVANPEILPEMADAYQQQMAKDRLASVSDDVIRPFPGAVLGNPNGSRTLIKFTDYACGYCRSAVSDVDRLIAADPELRVVVREWPIFDGSEKSARMGLAAARQGKFDEFYHAMFAAGPPSDETIAAASQAAGMDIAAARAFAASDEASAELARNAAHARQLGFTGTPSWIFEDQVIEGAVGYDRLAAIISENDG